jgi:predicted dehydrogenase
MPLPNELNRRDFMVAAAVAAGASAAPAFAIQRDTRQRGDRLRVGLVGCGGRGTGAAMDALSAGADVHVVALADVFADRLAECRAHLAAQGERGQVSESRCFSGFDGYLKLLDSGVDLVILATPPHFRPIHLAAAVEAGVHVFMEKPVAVDGPGVRSVLRSGAAAQSKGLSIVAGTQRRHEACYLEAMKQINNNAIGEIVAASCYWNMGGLWMKPRRPEWSDMEWQLRNWLYFTWLSGDHIVEQHVHNLDVCNWAIGSHPLRALGMGGRQVRTGPEYGHIFDHFAIEYEYPGGISVTSMCRQTDGCAGRVAEHIRGVLGSLRSTSGSAEIRGQNAWRFEGKNPNPYVQEHVDLQASIRSGAGLNEAQMVAEATLTAIMGRMSAYTGQEVTWEQAMDSTLDLAPPEYSFGPLPTPPVPVPGRTPLV